MYFTATSPYIFMLILLIRMSLLPGALNGILYYVVPDFTKLAEMQVSTQYNTMQCNTSQYNTTQYNTTQYNTIQYNITQYNTTQYNTI